MSNDNAPWFRLRGDKWKADTRGLNPQEKAIYIDLLVEMHEREAPLSDAWLEQVRSITRARPKTFFAGIEKLIALGLFVRTDDGLWSHFMASEIANRRGRSEKARRSANKSRQNPDQNPDFQPEKSQQNQRSGAAIEIQTEMKREAPKGASHHTNSYQDENCSGGAASADAGGSPTAEGREDTFSAGDPPTADAAASDEKRIRWMIDLCVERDDDLFMEDSIFIASLEGRDVSSFTPDDIRRLVNIVDALSAQGRSGVYFGDDGGGENSADEEWLSGWPDDEAEEFEVDEDGRERPIRAAR